MSFSCTICSEESFSICARCTKDTCTNHLCERCFRCSDCCECEVALNGQPPSARSVLSRHEHVVEEHVFDDLPMEEADADAGEPVAEDPVPAIHSNHFETSFEEPAPSEEPPLDQSS